MPADIRGNLDRLQRLSGQFHPASGVDPCQPAGTGRRVAEPATPRRPIRRRDPHRVHRGAGTARSMATTFAVAKSKENGGLQVGRDEVNAVLLNVLKSQPDFNGTYSCWEPDAIDGRDYLFTDGQNGNNAQTGRFTPYWTRSADGKIAVQPLVEYDTRTSTPTACSKAAGTSARGKPSRRACSALCHMSYRAGRSGWRRSRYQSSRTVASSVWPVPTMTSTSSSVSAGSLRKAVRGPG